MVVPFNMLMVCVGLSMLPLALSSGLQDDPLFGDGTLALYLDGEGWTATNGQMEIGATVPGELITDLQRAEVIGDPLFNTNFQGNIWDATEWTYFSPLFDLSSQYLDAKEVYLVFDGVKMAADVRLNGVFLNSTTDQFLRFYFAVKHILLPHGNNLSVTFHRSSDPLNSEDRWMACSGAWDWAPYASTFSPDGSHTFTKGIVKSVYLVPVTTAAVTAVVPSIVYSGPYATQPLTDMTASPFTVSLKIHFDSPAGFAGTLTATPRWTNSSVTVPVALGSGQTSITITLPTAKGVQLWWPAGLGPQALYSIHVAFNASGVAPWVTSRRVGFRVLHLVTGNESNVDPASSGSDSFTFRFKINGADLYSRGANMIPMEELEGRLSAAAHTALVQNVAAANFNTLRIWGGGIYLPPAFYDACDELGILLYHDLMFGQPWFGGKGGAPQATPLQDAEIRYNIRRLAKHPSIALWNGGNEWQGSLALWENFVMPAVVAEDQTRPVWPTSPSKGWASGVSTQTGLPNGQPFKAQTGFGVGTRLQFKQTDVFAQQQYGGQQFHAPQPRSSPNSSAGTCTFQPNLDVFNADGPSPAAATTDACCAACWADAQCTYAAFYNNVCYIKHGGVIGPATKDNVTLCSPVGKPAAPDAIETHGPYQHGSGFKTVNGDGNLIPFPPNLPPTLRSVATRYGPAAAGTFASEFGCSVFSSFESMAPTLPATAWTPHAPAMVQRNYPCDNIIQVYFGAQPDLNTTAGSSAVLHKSAFLCMLGQALEMKADIETRRSGNAFGTLTWQANEIWPTGGWGSLEYGTVGWTEGQVLGGRWKPLHHWMADHLYRSAVVLCGRDAACVIKNDDALQGLTATWVVSAVALASGTIRTVAFADARLPRGAGSATWFCAGSAQADAHVGCPAYSSFLPSVGCNANGTDCVLFARLTSHDGTVLDTNTILLATPGDIAAAGHLPEASVTVTVGTGVDVDGSVACTLQSDNTALFVHLTTTAQGRFSTNAFIMLAGTVVVSFIPSPLVPLDLGELTRSIRVEHVGSYVM